MTAEKKGRLNVKHQIRIAREDGSAFRLIYQTDSGMVWQYEEQFATLLGAMLSRENLQSQPEQPLDWTRVCHQPVVSIGPSKIGGEYQKEYFGLDKLVTSDKVVDGVVRDMQV